MLFNPTLNLTNLATLIGSLFILPTWLSALIIASSRIIIRNTNIIDSFFNILEKVYFVTNCKIVLTFVHLNKDIYVHRRITLEVAIIINLSQRLMATFDTSHIRSFVKIL